MIDNMLCRVLVSQLSHCPISFLPWLVTVYSCSPPGSAKLTNRNNHVMQSQTPQGSFSAQHSAHMPSNLKDSPDCSSKLNAPLKISNAFATLSSSTPLSSILSCMDGAEPPQQTPNSISQSPVQAPTQVSGTGMSTAQFDLAKLQSSPQALQGHRRISVALTNGNDDFHNFNPVVVHVEHWLTHSKAAECSSSSLVCCPTLYFTLPAVGFDCYGKQFNDHVLGLVLTPCFSIAHKLE